MKTLQEKWDKHSDMRRTPRERAARAVLLDAATEVASLTTIENGRTLVLNSDLSGALKALIDANEEWQRAQCAANGADEEG